MHTMPLHVTRTLPAQTLALIIIRQLVHTRQFYLLCTNLKHDAVPGRAGTAQRAGLLWRQEAACDRPYG